MKVLSLLVGIIIAMWIASFFPDLLLTLIVSALLAFVLRPIVLFLEFRFGMRRTYAVAIVFVLIGGGVTYGLYALIPVLIDRIGSLVAQLQQFPFEEKLTAAAKDILAGIPFVDTNTIGAKIHEMLTNGLSVLGDLAGTAASYLLNLVMIPFITFFILAEWDLAVKKFVERIPNKYFEMSLNVIDKLSKELLSYIRGLLMESGAVALISIIGMSIIGVPYALIIGAITGLANVVPYLGPIAGAGLALMFSMLKTGDFSMLLPIAILSLATRMIDDFVLQPLCFGKSLDMHPLAVLFTLLIGHQIMGVAGMVICIPIATILRVSAKETYWGLKHYSITA